MGAETDSGDVINEVIKAVRKVLVSHVAGCMIVTEPLSNKVTMGSQGLADYVVPLTRVAGSPSLASMSPPSTTSIWAPFLKRA